MSAPKMEVTEVDPCTRKLNLEFPFLHYQEEMEKAYSALNKKVSVHGFRQGKAPVRILERYYKDRVQAEVIQKLIAHSLREAADRENLKPIGQPRLEDFKVEDDKSVNMMLTIEVKPELKEVNYEGLEFVKKVKEVTQRDIDRETEALRERLAELVEKPAGPINSGDYATIDYRLFIEGETTPRERENITLPVTIEGTDRNIHEQMLGMRRGEEKEVKLRYPEDHPSQDLRGKEATFRVKVREVKTRILPLLDDDLARRAGNYETLEELKKDIAERLREYEEEEATNRLKNEVLTALLERNPVEAPNSLVEQEIDLRLLHLHHQLQREGARLNPSTEEAQKLRERTRKDAATHVKTSLILERIAQLKGLQVSEQELEEELKEAGRWSDQTRQTLKGQLEENTPLAHLRESLLREKTLNNIMEGYRIEVIIGQKIDEHAPGQHSATDKQEQSP